MNQSFLSIISRLLFGNKKYVAKYEINESVTGNFVKLRQGSGKVRQGKARMAKGERP